MHAGRGGGVALGGGHLGEGCHPSRSKPPGSVLGSIVAAKGFGRIKARHRRLATRIRSPKKRALVAWGMQYHPRLIDSESPLAARERLDQDKLAVLDFG